MLGGDSQADEKYEDVKIGDHKKTREHPIQRKFVEIKFLRIFSRRKEKKSIVGTW